MTSNQFKQFMKGVLALDERPGRGSGRKGEEDFTAVLSSFVAWVKKEPKEKVMNLICGFLDFKK